MYIANPAGYIEDLLHRIVIGIGIIDIAKIHMLIIGFFK